MWSPDRLHPAMCHRCGKYEAEPWREYFGLCQKCYILPSCQGMACPLERMHTGQRSCCYTKKQLHNELLTALEKPGRRVRFGETTGAMVPA